MFCIEAHSQCFVLDVLFLPCTVLHLGLQKNRETDQVEPNENLDSVEVYM